MLLSEPVAASFCQKGFEVHLSTECLNIGLCLESYSRVRPFSDYIDGRLQGYERIHVMRYEMHQRMHLLDAFAADAGICLERRLPRLRTGFERLICEEYGLICPNTSSWFAHMRQWPEDRFDLLKQRLIKSTPLRWVRLKPEHSFVQMMSLIQHADCVITNDSGPAHIAQAMGRRTIVLFGSTSAEYLLLSPAAIGITGSSGCTGCRHVAVDRSIACAHPICIESISVDEVAERVTAMCVDLRQSCTK